MRNAFRTGVRLQRSSEVWARNAEEMRAAQPSPEMALGEMQLLRRLAELIEALEEPYRHTIFLRYFEGLSAADIARAHHVPEGTVRWRLKTAVDDVRRRLEERDGPDWRRGLVPLLSGSPVTGLEASVIPVSGSSFALKLGLAALAACAAAVLVLNHRPANVATLAASPIATASPKPPAFVRTPRAMLDNAPTVPPPTAADERRIHEQTRAALTRGKPTLRDPPPEPSRVIGAAMPRGSSTVAGSQGATVMWPPPRLTLPDPSLGDRVKALLEPASSPALGPADAAVTVHYVNDFECASCPTGKVIVDGLRHSYGDLVRIVAKTVPFATSPNGQIAAEAAHAAHAQGKFWQMHDRMFEEPRTSLDRPTLERYAEELGLDLTKFRDALERRIFQPLVARDTAETRNAGVRAVPSFVVAGRMPGKPSALLQLVDTELLKGGIAPPPFEPPTVEVDPRAPGYDPARLWHYIPPHDAFAREPRDTEWAANMESRLAPMVEADLRAVTPHLTSLACDVG